MLLFAAALFLLKTRIRIKCTKEEEANIEGMDYKICYTDVVNAWYDPEKRKIYVSNKLHEALGKDELKAVLLHKRGHAESKILRLFSAGVMFLWYWGLSPTFAVVYLAMYSAPGNTSKIALVAALVPPIPRGKP